MSQDYKVYKVGFFVKILVALIAIIIKILFKTINIKVLRKDDFSPRRNNTFVIWHNRVLWATYLVMKYFQGGKLFVLVSPSRDGAILTEFLRHFNVESIRGSSSKGSIKALITAITEGKCGNSIGLTPDGPRGPKYKMKRGAFEICKQTGSEFVFIRVDIKNYWRFNSWDNFILPKPFGNVVIHSFRFKNYEEFESSSEEHGGMLVYAEKLLGDDSQLGK